MRPQRFCERQISVRGIGLISSTLSSSLLSDRLRDAGGERGQIYGRLGCASIRTNRARERELRVGLRERLWVNIGKRFAGVRFDERLLVSSARR